MAKNHYLKLDSAVYVNDFVKREEARQRCQRIRKALDDCLLLCGLSLAIGVGVYAGLHHQAWLPAFQQMLQQLG